MAPLLLVDAHESFASKNEGELVLVVGGSGGIGQFAIYDLLQRGYKVRACIHATLGWHAFMLSKREFHMHMSIIPYALVNNRIDA